MSAHNSKIVDLGSLFYSQQELKETAVPPPTDAFQRFSYSPAALEQRFNRTEREQQHSVPRNFEVDLSPLAGPLAPPTKGPEHS